MGLIGRARQSRIGRLPGAASAMLAALLFLPACAGLRSPSRSPILPMAPSSSGNLHLHISNKSVKTEHASLRVELIDADGFADPGRLLYAGRVFVGDQHQWLRLRFDIPDGRYILYVYEESRGCVAIERMHISNAAPTHVSVRFWHSAENWVSPRPYLEIEEESEAPTS